MNVQSRNILRWVGAFVVPAITTAGLAWAGAGGTIAGLVFLALVVVTATQEGIALSLVVALLCAWFFDYYFLPPFHTLSLAGPQEWVGLFAFMGCSVIAGRVAERARRQAHQAEQRREDLERLYTLSQEMMLFDDAAGLTAALPTIIARIFALDAVALFVRDREQYASTSTELPESLRASLSALPQGTGQVEIVPNEITAMPLLLGMRPVGALGWKPARLSREAATAVCAQVAIALARAQASEMAARLEASREGERLRAALIDSLTHELRTPLTSIRAAATTLLQNQGLDEAVRTDLAAIVDEESARLDALIGEAVEMAELDAKVVRVELEQQAIRPVLEEAVERSHAALSGRQTVIAVDEPDQPAWFDPKLIGRVLRHLLENAARYTPPGSRIAIRGGRANNRVEFAVEDNGPGIDPKDLPLIFEKFYRGSKSSAKGKGTGMGLAIARAILAAHGGEIEAISTPGHGAIFRFWVPLVTEDPTTQTDAQEIPKL